MIRLAVLGMLLIAMTGCGTKFSESEAKRPKRLWYATVWLAPCEPYRSDGQACVQLRANTSNIHAHSFVVHVGDGLTLVSQTDSPQRVFADADGGSTLSTIRLTGFGTFRIGSVRLWYKWRNKTREYDSVANFADHEYWISSEAP